MINKHRTKIRKAKVFTVEELGKYLLHASNTGEYIIDKLLLLFGILENLICNELTYLKVEDVHLLSDVKGNLELLVLIRKSKTDQQGKGYKFVVQSMNTDFFPVKLYLVRNWKWSKVEDCGEPSTTNRNRLQQDH